MINKDSEKTSFKITKEGSLGLLAFGDIGIRAWRKVKNKTSQNSSNEKK